MDLKFAGSFPDESHKVTQLVDVGTYYVFSDSPKMAVGLGLSGIVLPSLYN